jgi:ligand-binding sensor domain-containing protein
MMKNFERLRPKLCWLQKLKNSLILILTLFAFSCNSQSHGKLPSDKESAKATNIQETNNKKSKPIKYGDGDIVTEGFLDQSGKMWFATTKEGVYSYDGTTFINYTEKDGLCNNEVWSIIQDNKGVLWFGTASGLCSYDGKTFHNIPIPKDNATSDWMDEGYPIINPNSAISMIQDKNDDFWIGSNGAGVYRYDGKIFTSFLKEKGKLMPDSLHHNVITSIIEDKAGNIWFSSFSHGGITKYDGTVFTHYGVENGLGDDMISTSYLDRSANLWFGTRSGGMSSFDGETFFTIKESSGPCENNMARLYEDKSGILWVASYARKGVCWYDGTSFIPFLVEGSENLVDVKFISEDKAGNIWFGGRRGILWRYDGKILTDFTQKGRE